MIIPNSFISSGNLKEYSLWHLCTTSMYVGTIHCLCKYILYCKSLYTERQKKHHFFRATLAKIHIKINHIWIQISYSSPYESTSEKTKGCLCEKGENCSEIETSHFQKSQKLLTERAPQKAALSEHSIAIH